MPLPAYTGYQELEKLSQEDITPKSEQRLPLFVPWHPNKMVPLGSMFFSTEPKDPWGKSSPFDQGSLANTAMVVSRDYGGENTFRSQSTSRSTQTNDHLEIGLGVGVGLPFLASVTVKGDYARSIQENTDTNKTSINFSVRAGAVSFERQPRLTSDAIITIKYNGGLAAFSKRYGDYYLAGYRLGGDTGILVSGGSKMRDKLESFAITVTVEVLFIEESTTHTMHQTEHEESESIKLVGYDTLGHTTYNSASEAKGDGNAAVRARGADYCTKAKTLDLRVSEKLDELNIHDGNVLGLDDCRELVESGLVVELMLLPVITLREVQAWCIEDDVI